MSETLIPPKIVKLTPKWVRISDALSYSGLSRTTVYRLLSEGKIEGIVLSEPGRKSGTRLVNVNSIDRYFESFRGKENPAR